MANKLATIGGVDISENDLLRYLKLSGRITPILSDMVIQQLVRNYFIQNQMEISIDELQRACDHFRSNIGLYKASSTHEWFNSLNISIDDFEQFIETGLMVSKLKKDVASIENVKAYFKEHHKEYDTVVISHIFVTEEGRASLIYSEIQDEIEDFAVMARKYSENKKTSKTGGYLGAIRMKDLQKDIAIKIQESQPDDIIGPIAINDGFEIIKINQIEKATELTDDIMEEINDILFKQWVKEQRKLVTSQD